MKEFSAFLSKLSKLDKARKKGAAQTERRAKAAVTLRGAGEQGAGEAVAGLENTAAAEKKKAGQGTPS